MRSRVLNDQVEHRKTQHGLVEISICVMEILMMVSIACEHYPEGGLWEAQKALALPLPVCLRPLGFSLSYITQEGLFTGYDERMSATGRNVHTISRRNYLFCLLLLLLLLLFCFFNAFILLPYFKWNKWLIYQFFLCVTARFVLDRS